MDGLMLRRREMTQTKKASRLPAGYTEVEYLQGTGTQYIITGIKPTNAMTEADFQFGTIASGTDGAFCAKYDASNQRYYTCSKDAHNKFTFKTRANSTQWSRAFDTDRHQIIFNNPSHQCYFDGALVATNSGFSCTSSSTPLGVFCRNKTGGPEAISPVKIYSLKVTGNSSGTVLINFVPAVRDSDGTAGMYDLATDTFFENDGTGDFIAGPAV